MAIQKDRNVDTGKRKVHVRSEIYNSAEEVVIDCKNRKVRHNEYSMERREITKSWQGVDSYDEALDLLKTGYQPTVEELRGEMKVAPKEGPRFKFENKIEGFLPVVPLALKGIPNCMVNMTMKPIKAKVLNVYYDMTANCDKNPDQFIRAGKELLGTVIGLEKQGYRFNLYAVQSYQGSSSGERTCDFLCVKVKSSDKPLDLKRISFPLTHPAFFRVIGFDWQAKSPITRYIGCGRGRALGNDYNEEETEKIVKSMYGDNAFYVSCSRFIDSGYDTETLKGVFTNGKKKK